MFRASHLLQIVAAAVFFLQCRATFVTSGGVANQGRPRTRILSASYDILSVQTDGSLLSIDIEAVPCETDQDCEDALPNLDVALNMGSNVPSQPYCVPDSDHPHNATGSPIGHCSCGSGKCVSQSMRFDFGTDSTFYYCGDCSRVGAQCQNDTCSHFMAVCKDDYCQCKSDGIFYEFNYCDIPYVAYETSLQACIILCIVIVGLIILSSIYSICQQQPWWQSRFRVDTATQSSPSGDLPPDYDEIMESLPSYQDALQMEQDEGSPNLTDDNSDRSPNDEDEPIDHERDEPSTSHPDIADTDGDTIQVTSVHTSKTFTQDDSKSEDGGRESLRSYQIATTRESCNSNFEEEDLANVHDSSSSPVSQPTEATLQQLSGEIETYL